MPLFSTFKTPILSAELCFVFLWLLSHLRGVQFHGVSIVLGLGVALLLLLVPMFVFLSELDLAHRIFPSSLLSSFLHSLVDLDGHVDHAFHRRRSDAPRYFVLN